MEYRRPITESVAKALREKTNFIHVLTGPRQVGKTTAAQQLRSTISMPSHFASADSPIPHTAEWIEAQWEAARGIGSDAAEVLLVLDEIQKIRGWSETIKLLWDTQQRKKSTPHIRPLLLGSSALLVQKGLSESLAGRFLLHRFPHWSFPECRDAFGWDLFRWLYFGGYPGAAPLIDDISLWKGYITDSLIDTVITRDVLQMQTVQKPALLRNLFGLATNYPAQILSYNKMLGQLAEAGNTTTLSHYLDLLGTAFLISGLEQFSLKAVKSRASSPKLILWNNALINAPSLQDFKTTRQDASFWGRLVENAVGATLLNTLQDLSWKIGYWREGHDEVDFVVQHGKRLWAIEVKSGRYGKLSGMGAFLKRFPKASCVTIGGPEVTLEAFFSDSPLAILLGKE